MIVFPEIQIARGRLVASIELPGELDDPVALAQHCAEQGAGFLHVVDRDGSAETHTAIRMVADAFDGHVQLEHTPDDFNQVEQWFDAGISRLVLDNRDPHALTALAAEWPGGIAVGIEAENVAHAIGFARHYAVGDVAAIVITDPQRRGTAAGCDIDKLMEVLHRVDTPIIWRGGVRTLGELRLMTLQAKNGIEGVICGRALLEGPLDLQSALAMAERD